MSQSDLPQETKDIAQIIAEAMSQNDPDPAAINVDCLSEFDDGDYIRLGEVPIHLRPIVALAEKMWVEYYGPDSKHDDIPDIVVYEMDALQEVYFASIRRHLPNCCAYDIKICKNWIVAGRKDNDEFVETTDEATDIQPPMHVGV